MKRPFLVLFLLLPLLSWGQKEYSLKGTDFWVSVPNGIGIDSILLQVCSHTTCTAIFTIGQNILFILGLIDIVFHLRGRIKAR